MGSEKEDQSETQRRKKCVSDCLTSPLIRRCLFSQIIGTAPGLDSKMHSCRDGQCCFEGVLAGGSQRRAVGMYVPSRLSFETGE